MSRQQNEAAPRSRPTLIQLDRFAASRGLARLWSGPDRERGTFRWDAYESARDLWHAEHAAIIAAEASS